MRLEQAQPPGNSRGNMPWLRRVGIALSVWWLVYLTTRPSARMADAAALPSGFLDGVLHGASMPLALPRLLMGQDTTIYALSNTGHGYKLGYTAGVNGCGALFFGIIYWRVVRWSKERKSPGNQ